jgi:2-haloacid dehalogenase
VSRIDAVVFDLGGVLLDWNPRYLYRQLFTDENAMEKFLANVCTLEWHVAHDLGHSTAESCAELARRHPAQAEMIQAWAERSEDMVAGAIDETVEILSELRAAGTPCYVLSNMERESFPLRLARFEFLQSFDGYVISGLEGVVKPDPKIFELLLERFGLDRRHTLFIDDSPANVDAANAIGLPAIHYRSADDLRRRLVEHGLLRA